MRRKGRMDFYRAATPEAVSQYGRAVERSTPENAAPENAAPESVTPENACCGRAGVAVYGLAPGVKNADANDSSAVVIWERARTGGNVCAGTRERERAGRGAWRERMGRSSWPERMAGTHGRSAYARAFSL